VRSQADGATLTGSRENRYPRLLAAFAAVLLAALLGAALADAASAPTAAIDPPGEVGFNSVQLSGEVNPGEAASTCWFFQYIAKAEKEAAEGNGEEPSWNSANFECFSEEDSAKNEALPVAAKAGGLAPGTAYLVRLGASNEAGEQFSSSEEIETDPVDPPSVSALAVTAVTADSAHFDGTVNSGGSGPGEASTYTLECSPICPDLSGEADGAPVTSTSGAIEGTTASGADVAIALDATGLEPHREYTVTLRIADAAGLSAEESASFTTEAVTPEVEVGLAPRELADTTARVFGSVNPHNSDTTFRFEYGTSAAYGQTTEVGGPISGNSFQIVSRILKGLQPSTVYHYRLVVDNGVGGPAFGPDGTFTTTATPPECPNEEIRQEQGSTHLPDCMAYELVSPADTGGADLQQAYASTDGDHAWVASLVPMSSDQATGNFSTLAMTRTARGWQARDLADASAPGSETTILAGRSVDASRSILFRCEITLLGCPSDVTYERVEADGSRTILAAIPHPSIGIPLPYFVGVSDDASRIFFQLTAGQSLLEEDTHTSGEGLYSSVDGALEYLGFDQHGDVLDCGAVLAGGIDEGQDAGFYQNGLSSDGRSVVFASPAPTSDCQDPRDLYLRRDGQSVNISAPRNGQPDLGAVYVGNSRDGKTVYFITPSQLVDSDADNASDLYSYDAAADEVTRLTPGAEVLNAAVSPGGNYVYFTASNSIDGEGTPGGGDLYMYHAGEITHLVEAPNGAIALGGSMMHQAYSPITPDGRHLLFLSYAPLTGVPTQERYQIFQFSVETDKLVCISCHPDGTAPAESTLFPTLAPDRNVDQRLQSDDGSTVVFQTTESLLPKDMNLGLTDVYIWREGKLSLISGGHGGSASFLTGTTASGRDVFFKTVDRLTPDAEQDNWKLYDARIGGGFSQPPIPTPCLGDECRTSLTLTPPSAEVGTSKPQRTFKLRSHRKRHCHRRRAKRNHCQHVKNHHHKRAHRNTGESR
jgi:hypothetical protein